MLEVFLEKGVTRIVIFMLSLSLGPIMINCLGIKNGHTAFLALSLGLLIAIAQFFTFKCLDEKGVSESHGKDSFVRLICLFITGIILEALTVLGTPDASLLSFSAWSKARIAIYILLSYFALASYSYFKRFVLPPFDFSLPPLLKDLNKYSDEHSIGKALIALATALLLALALSLFLGLGFGISFLIVAAISSSCFAVILGAKHELPLEAMFLIFALAITTFISFSLPAETKLALDDQIHYHNSLTLSYMFYPHYTAADDALTLEVGYDNDVTSVNWISPDVWDAQSTRNYNSQLNSAFNRGVTHSRTFQEAAPKISIIAYTPSAIGLFIGRTLHLPMSLTFSIGRWFNGLFYAFICYLAIRCAPRCKVVFFAIAMIPETLYMASNYSYDPWSTSWMLLGTSLLMRLSTKDVNRVLNPMLLVLACYTFSMVVRAVYFPVLLVPLVFIVAHRTRYSDSLQTCLLIIIVALFLVSSFVFPIIFSKGVAYSDTRGGSDVSTLGQMRHVLNHPLEFAEMTASHLFNKYLNPAMSGFYFFDYAYLGNLLDYLYGLQTVPAILFISLALIDNSNDVCDFVESPVMKWTFILAFLFSVILCAASMYVSFTPVGLDTINGLQPRYLIPLLVFPLMAFQRKSHTSQPIPTLFVGPIICLVLAWITTIILIVIPLL